jgi:hypothetical protein
VNIQIACFHRFLLPALPKGGPPMKVTKAAVAALQLPAGKTDHFFWDDATPGFGNLRRCTAGRSTA